MPGISVGLIGCGQIVQGVHLQILSTLPGVRVVALAEPDSTRRAQAQQRVPGAKAVARWEDLLAMGDVDAVVICLPTGMHAPVALAAFEAGKHVYLEKPIATTVEEGEAVVDAWRRSGLVGMIGFNYRFNPLLLALRAQLAAGRIGQIVSIRSVFSASASSVPPWKQSRKTGGGVLLDLASHHVDLVRFLLGAEVSDVSANIRSVRHSEDTATLEMRLSDDVLVQSFFSLASAEEDRWEIFGTDGRLAVDRYASAAVEYQPPLRAYGRVKQVLAGVRGIGGLAHRVRKLLAPSGELSYRPALAHFAEAVGNRRLASPDLQDGLRSLAVIEAAEESARTRQTVALSSASAGIVSGVR